MAASLLRPLQAIALALCLVPALQGGAAESLDALLAEADAVRTADLARLDELLARIDGQLDDADDRQRARARLLHAHRMLTSGRTDSAIEVLKAIVDSDDDDAVRHSASFMLANAYAITRRFEDALRMVEVTRSLQGSVKDPVARHRGLAVAGIVYNQVGEYGLGAQQAQEMLADAPDGRNRCMGENLVIEARLGLDEPVGIADAERAVAHCDSQGETILAGFSRAYLARLLHRDGRTGEAIATLERFLPQVEATRYPVLIGQFHSLLAEFRLSEGREGQSAAHARRAVEVLAPVASSHALVSAYRTLYALAESNGDPREALSAYRLYSESDRAHFGDMKSREMAYQVVRHQAQQQAQQIELLNQRNELLELQKRVTEQRAQSWLVVVLLLVLLLATISYWAYKTKKLQLRLRRMAEVDMLTCISNRYHFGNKAGRALELARRNGESAALLMFDLDHFKQVNDRHGHDAGDWALKQVAHACAELCGPDDCFARLGGEEFAMLLPGRDAACATRVADAALERIERIDTSSQGGDFRLSASFGITDTERSGHDLTRMLSHADHAMYSAKLSGRGCTCVFTPGHDDNVTPFPIVPDHARAARGREDAVGSPAPDRERISHP